MTTLVKKAPKAETALSKEHPTSEVFRKPFYRVLSEKDRNEVHVFMPGVSKDDFELTLKNKTMTILGHRRSKTPENWRTLHREIPELDFKLQLQLNVKVDESKICAKYENGILRLHLPILEQAKPRSIPVD